MQLQPIGAATFADAISTFATFVSSILHRGGIASPALLSIGASPPFSLVTIVVQVAVPAAAGLGGAEG